MPESPSMPTKAVWQRTFFVYRLNCDCGEQFIARMHEPSGFVRCNCGSKVFRSKFDLVGRVRSHSSSNAIQQAKGEAPHEGRWVYSGPKSFFVYRLNCECGQHLVARPTYRACWLKCQCGKTIWSESYTFVGVFVAKTKEEALRQASKPEVCHA